jgi:hypothetical protein
VPPRPTLTPQARSTHGTSVPGHLPAQSRWRDCVQISERAILWSSRSSLLSIQLRLLLASPVETADCLFKSFQDRMRAFARRARLRHKQCPDKERVVPKLNDSHILFVSTPATARPASSR